MSGYGPLDGVILIDKPVGLVSRKVVNEVNRILKVRRAGHLGTLDPFATGVLPVVIGRATRIGPFLMMEPKEYEGTLSLGVETDTDDATGKVTKNWPLTDLSEDLVKAAFGRFQGKINQLPPLYSALKHNGVASYKLARQGKEVPRKERVVEVHELVLINFAFPLISFRVVCSGGTYVRALARDIGRALNTGAHLVSLRRLRNGPFFIQDCLPLEKFKELVAAGLADQAIMPLNRVLGHLRGIPVPAEAKAQIGQGQKVRSLDGTTSALISLVQAELVRLVSQEGELLAVAQALHGDNEWVFHPVRVFA